VGVLVGVMVGDIWAWGKVGDILISGVRLDATCVVWVVNKPDKSGSEMVGMVLFWLVIPSRIPKTIKTPLSMNERRARLACSCFSRK